VGQTSGDLGRWQHDRVLVGQSYSVRRSTHANIRSQPLSIDNIPESKSARMLKTSDRPTEVHYSSNYSVFGAWVDFSAAVGIWGGILGGRDRGLWEYGLCGRDW
jgi:hypothetical protein